MIRLAAMAAAAFLSGTAPMLAFDLQGHRGARGLYPENTLAGFAAAVTLGVSTLETDLAVTKDGHVVLTHDPRLNPDLVRRGPRVHAPQLGLTDYGPWLDAPGPTIRLLTRDELHATYDVGRLKPGTRYAAQWPEQKPADGSIIPELFDLFGRADAQSDGRIRYNIETKLSPLKPDETADAATFVAAVLKVIADYEAVAKHPIRPRVTLQSFDWRTLVEMKRRAPEIATVCLSIEALTFNTVQPVEGQPSPWLAGLDPAAHGGSIAKTAQAASCGTWSPFWRNVTAENVKEAQALGLKVIPWTVNEPADMGRLIDLGIDGLITDYPDRAKALLDARGIAIK